MAWYRTGKIAINKSSKVVTGTGTDFMDAVRPGFVLQAPDGKVYEVDNVLTATVMHIVESYAGNSVSNADFAIWQTQGEIPALAKTATDLIGRFGRIADAFDTGILEPVLSGQILDVAEGVASAKQATAQAALEAEKALVEANRATAAANNAAAVVTGGTATLLPAAAKIPLARADATVDPNWLGRTALPAIRPVFAADFTKGVIDPRLTFARSTIGIETGRQALRAANVNEPRLSLDSKGQDSGLLIEPQAVRLNLGLTTLAPALYKDVTRTPLPDYRGLSGGIKVAATTASELHGIFLHTYPVDSVRRRSSVIVSAAEYEFIALSRRITYTSNPAGSSHFDLKNGVIVVHGANYMEPRIENLGGGLYRCSIINDCTTTVSNSLALFVEKDNNGSGVPQVFAGNGTSGINLYHAQCETGERATSPIFGEGTQVTRVADSSSIPLDRINFNPKEGTLLIEFDRLGTSKSTIFVLNAAQSSTYDIRYEVEEAKGNFITRIAGTNNPPVVISDSGNKVAIRYVSGITSEASTRGVISLSRPAPDTALLKTLMIGQYYTLASSDAVIIKSIQYYDKALGDDQFKALTAN